MRSTRGPGSDSFPITIDESSDADAALLILRRDLDLATAPALDAHVGALIRRGRTRIQIDFAGAGFIDPKALAILVSTARRLSTHGRPLILSGVAPHLMKIFEITGVVRYLEFASEGEGTAARAAPRGELRHGGGRGSAGSARP